MPVTARWVFLCVQHHRATTMTARGTVEGWGGPAKRRRRGAMASGSTLTRDVEFRLRQACAELKERLRAGEACGAEQLLARYVDLSARDDCAVELIYTEWVTREELGQTPSAEEFLDRFPGWRARLARLLE